MLDIGAILNPKKILPPLLLQMGYIVPGYNTVLAHYGEEGLLYRSMNALWVNANGERFFDESVPEGGRGLAAGAELLKQPDGRAWIIDPAAYYGHPEADLAMTELFGGFAPDFYDSYFACAKMETGYQDRKDIYNLYHLLNHLNLFGVSYLSSVQRILRRYGRT